MYDIDIKVKEQSIENLARGRKIYEPPRYMTVNQAVEQLLEVEDKRGEKAYTSETLAVGCARVGTAEQKLISGTLQQLLDADFGGPLHSLVLVGKRMHELEAEFVKEFAVDRANFDEIVKKDYSH
jgi:diphthine synthase